MKDRKDTGYFVNPDDCITMTFEVFLKTDFSKKTTGPSGIFIIRATDTSPTGREVAVRYSGTADYLAEIQENCRKTDCEWMTRDQFKATDFGSTKRLRRIRILDKETGDEEEKFKFVEEVIGNAVALVKKRNKMKSPHFGWRKSENREPAVSAD